MAICLKYALLVRWFCCLPSSRRLCKHQLCLKLTILCWAAGSVMSCRLRLYSINKQMSHIFLHLYPRACPHHNSLHCRCHSTQLQPGAAAVDTDIPTIFGLVCSPDVPHQKLKPCIFTEKHTTRVSIQQNYYLKT